MVLVGYWPLNESSGSTALDYSGQGNDGTVNNGGDSTVVGGGQFLGQNTYSFDGSNDEVVLGDLNSMDVGAGGVLSMSGWIKTSSSPAFIIQKYDSNWVGYNFGLDSSGNGRLWSNDGSNTYSVTGSSLADGLWHHLVGVFNGSNLILYIDGVKKASASQSSNSYANAASSKIMHDDGGDNSTYHSGNVAEVRIYNHALTPSEIQYLYSAGKRGQLTTRKKRS